MTKLFEDIDQDEVDIIIPEDEPLKPFLEKYKDPMGIAKSLVEKDRFIKQLQSENAGLRVDAVTRKTVEETVDRLLQRPPTQIPNPPLETSSGSQPNLQPASNGVSLEDVEKLLNEKEQSVKAKANADYARKELEKLYGPEWVSQVKAKAKELGESMEFIDSLAQTKPNVLLKLFTQPTKASQPSLFTGENTTQQTLSLGTTTQRTMKYYQDMKAKNLTQYNSPKVQNQMHLDALQLREAFFDV